MTIPVPDAYGFRFDNSYARDLKGLYAPCQAAPANMPKLLTFNASLAEELGLDASGLDSPQGARFFAGNDMPDGANPLAQAYAGHQFGGYNPQLGDGRALLLGEIITPRGQRLDIQLKGSGPTPFSRGGDGKAAIGPVLREYLIAEAMNALGVPTTRALAAVATGETLYREGGVPGAVLTRIAASHIRVGTFQFVAAREDLGMIGAMADYTIERHYPQARNDANPYLALLSGVVDAQARLVAHWMGNGFIHGVMNTDNMTVSGETIDYGPCAFMDTFDPQTVFSSIDRQGRYAYANQPSIAQWNLARFAETLLPLINEDEDTAIEQAKALISDFAERYSDQWLERFSSKLGITGHDPDESSELIGDLLDLMAEQKADFTLSFRRLADVLDGSDAAFKSQFRDPQSTNQWLTRWQAIVDKQALPTADIAAAMRQTNPIYIPRNHTVEQALQTAADIGDLSAFERLYTVLQHPFEEQAELEEYARPAPKTFGHYVTYCGT